MIRTGKTVYILFAAFMLISCGDIQEVEIREVKNFQFLGLENNNARFIADLNVYNPNHQKFKVKNIDVKVLANDYYLGRMICDEEIIIPAYGETLISVPCGLRIANIFTGISAIYKFSQQDKVRVEIDGYVTAQVGIIRKKVKVNRTMMVSPPNK